MELKRTVIFLGLIGLVGFGSQLLFGAYLSQFGAEPVTAKKICAENERLLQIEGQKDYLKPMAVRPVEGLLTLATEPLSRPPYAIRIPSPKVLNTTPH
ncbi:MAG: hypothetical protein AAFZ17_09145 [Cyanobacteria bacterium J06650_10]